jgi:hypothetical protein
MTKLILPLLFVLALCVAQCGGDAEVQYATYVNNKFGYEVKYPEQVLIAQGESANGYGQIYESKDDSARLKTYGKFNTSDLTLEESFEEAQNGEVTEKNIDEKAGMFTVTGVHGGTVYNIRMYLIDNVYIVYEFRYPEDKKDFYGPMNEVMLQSLKVF